MAATTSRASSVARGSSGVTRVERPGSATTSPASASRSSASRTGVRLTPSQPASSRSRRLSSGFEGAVDDGRLEPAEHLVPQQRAAHRGLPGRNRHAIYCTSRAARRQPVGLAHLVDASPRPDVCEAYADGARAPGRRLRWWAPARRTRRSRRGRPAPGTAADGLLGAASAGADRQAPAAPRCRHRPGQRRSGRHRSGRRRSGRHRSGRVLVVLVLAGVLLAGTVLTPAVLVAVVLAGAVLTGAVLVVLLPGVALGVAGAGGRIAAGPPPPGGFAAGGGVVAGGGGAAVRRAGGRVRAGPAGPAARTRR